MTKTTTMKFKEFSDWYCSRQEQTPEGLQKIFEVQLTKYNPDGWALLQVADFGSSEFGRLWVLPFGGECTFKEIPDRPISRNGLASNMSTVVAILPASELRGETK